MDIIIMIIWCYFTAPKAGRKSRGQLFWKLREYRKQIEGNPLCQNGICPFYAAKETVSFGR